MNRIIRLLGSLLVAGCLGCAGCVRVDRYVRISGYAQGGVYAVTVNLKGASLRPEALRDSVEALLHHVDTTLSGYNKGSLLSRFNAGEPICPNALFLQMYEQAYALYQRSGGVLDFAAGPLFDAWGFGFREGSLPPADTVQRLLSRCGMGRLAPSLRPLVRADGTLRAEDVCPGGVVLNYNAVAQGTTCDLVAAFLHAHGVQDMLVDIGEIWCEGLNPDRRPWAVGIDRPVDGNDTPGADLTDVWTSPGSGCGLVTSGNYRKFYVRDGRKYAHTIDPRTGYPVQHRLLSATVASERGAGEADALATWCMVVGVSGAQELLQSDGALEGYLVYEDDRGQMGIWSTPGFRLR